MLTMYPVALSPVLQKFQDTVSKFVETTILAQAERDEKVVRFLLEHWVSELEPALAIDENQNIMGLTPADTPIGVKGFILCLEECA